MKHLLYTILLTLPLFVGCQENDPEPRPVPPRPETATHTLLMFLGGRGNLVSAFDRNIVNALKSITPDIPGNGRILVFRQTSASSAEISELLYDAQTGTSVQQTLKRYDETLQSTDGATVTRILKDMIALSPSKEYGLVMGSHATGWVPTPNIKLSGIPGLSSMPDNYWLRTSEETRGFGLDNGLTMKIPDLAASLNATGAKFEYLIFDACLMSSIEAIYDLRQSAPHIIGSPCEVMLYGVPYDTAIPYLFQERGTKYDLRGFCEAFHTFYSTTTATRQSGCIAMAESAELEALADVIRRINATAPKTVDPSKLQIYEGLSPHLFYDLGDFVRASCSDATLRAEFDTLFDRAFPPAYRLHTPEFFTDYSSQMIPITSYSGVSVSEPSTKFTDDNHQTNWYKATRP